MPKVPILAVLVSLFLAGCGSGTVDRIVRVTDTGQSRPVANKTFVFDEDGSMAPLIKGAEPITAVLDAQGEVHIKLPCAPGWARINDGNTNSYGVSLKAADIVKGGRFVLYARPSVPGDTNLFPSKYLLEIQKP